ncbi:MAG: hypothetical protein IPQ09_26195 [Myxococcales bacterium]|nr:hypothetical protein [Myxococcales bacterium]
MAYDPDRIPTLPRPAPMPREEAPTPIPRRSSLEELRAGEDPYVAAIDELRVEVLRLSARLPELDARTSKTDLAQEARLSEHEMRLARIEAASKAAASDTSTLVHALTGKLSPKVLGAFVALGTLVQILLQAYRQLHGGTP